jgi:hypothetical protein
VSLTLGIWPFLDLVLDSGAMGVWPTPPMKINLRKDLTL